MINSACKERIYGLKNKIIGDLIRFLFPIGNENQPASRFPQFEAVKSSNNTGKYDRLNAMIQ